MNITEALRETNSLNIFTKPYIKNIESILLNDEQVSYAVSLNMVKDPNGASMSNPKIIKGNINGVFVITKMRLLFFYRPNNILVNHKEMSLDSIKDIDVASKVIISAIRITSYSETWIFDVPQKLQSIIMSKIGEARKQDSNMGVGQTADSNDAYDEIRKLKCLLDDGIITQDEFEKKKSQLLGI